MRFRPPLRMSVTRRGEKEQRLGEFIAEHLAEVRSVRLQPRSEILVIARSVESPVVRRSLRSPQKSWPPATACA
jgi:hypothetical protein